MNEAIITLHYNAKKNLKKYCEHGTMHWRKITLGLYYSSNNQYYYEVKKYGTVPTVYIEVSG